jgi:lysophospholipase L1-like esterase
MPITANAPGPRTYNYRGSSIPFGAGMPSGALGIWYAANYNATAKAIPNSATSTSLQTGMITRNPRGVFDTSKANGNGGGGGWLGGGFGGCTVTEKYATGRDGVLAATRAVFSSATSGIRYRQTLSLLAGTYTMAIDAWTESGTVDFFMSKDGETTTVTKTATTTKQQFKYEFTLGSTTTVDLRFCRPTTGNGTVIIDKAYLWNGDTASVPSDISLGGHLFLGNSTRETVTCTGGELALTSNQVGQIDFDADTTATECTILVVAKRMIDYKTAGAGRYPFLNPNTESSSGGAGGPGASFGFYDNENNLVGNFGSTRQATCYGGTGATRFPVGTCPNLFSNGQYHVLSFRSELKNRSMWVDDCGLANTHTDSWGTTTVTSRHFEIGYNQGFDAFKVVAMAMYPTALSKADQHKAVTYLISKAAESSITVTRPKNLLLAEGDSITVGPANNSYVQQFLANSAASAFSVYNIGAVGGSMLSTNVSPDLNLSVRLPQHLKGIPASLTGRKAIATLMFGTNDLASYVSVAAYLTEYYTYVAQLRALGVTVGICTILAKGPAQVGYAAFNTARNAMNAQLRLDVGAYFDFLIDFAANATMGTDIAPTNLTNFNADQLHPNVTGQGLLEVDYRAAVNPLLL